MKNAIYFLLLTFGLAVLFTNCEGDDPDIMAQETTVAEDMANIVSAVNDLISCTETTFAGKLERIIRDFGGFGAGFISNEDWVSEIFEELDDLMSFSSLEDGGSFDFSGLSGTYNWNNSTSAWSYSNNLSNKIIVNLPDKKSNNANNISLVLNSLSQEEIRFDTKPYTSPELMEFSATHNGEEFFSISIDNVQYDHNSKYSIPTKFNIEFFAAPNTWTFKLDRLTPTKFNFKMAMGEAGCDWDLDATLDLSSSDYDNLTEDDLLSGRGTFKTGRMEFRFEADLKSILEIDEPTPSQINSLANADVYYFGVQIGELDYEENSIIDTIFINPTDSSDVYTQENTEIDLFITYKDGSRDNLEVYYDDLMLSLVELTRPYFDPEDANWYPF